MRKSTARLALLNKTKKVEYRHILQDWDVWLSKPDSKGNDVNLHLENIYLEQLEAEGLLLYDRLQHKFKYPLVGAGQFYLQYKLSSEQYPIDIELSDPWQAITAFKKFAKLKKEVYTAFGPVFVLCCRGPLWTAAPVQEGITIKEIKGRSALTRYLADKYVKGKLSLTIFDEIMTLATAPLRRAVYGIMPNAEREYHGYLLQSAVTEQLDPEHLFLAGNITITEYEEMRFPEAKEEKALRDAEYPQTEEPACCIVCRDMTAKISCMECRNKVCQACVRTVCLDRKESFLYFHHQHCLRFGRPHREQLPVAEDVRRRGMPGCMSPPGRNGVGNTVIKGKRRFRPPSGILSRAQPQGSGE